MRCWGTWNGTLARDTAGMDKQWEVGAFGGLECK